MIKTNNVYCMDNLQLFDQIPNNFINLIYCDILYGTGKKFSDFKDLEPQINIIKDFYIPRFIEMKRILKETGSIFIHCDWHINHWIRCILDNIFNYNNLINEIIWYYTGSGVSKICFAKRHDTIYWYSKTNKWIFNVDEVRSEYSQATIDRFKYTINNKRNNNDFGQQKLNPLGKHPDDVFEISIVAPSSKERVDYSTQKPKPLLEKIIKAASNEGDIVADFFCGSGSTLVVAKELKRNYIGCDINPKAIIITFERLQKVS